MAMRATIILPTFGDAPFVRRAIASAQLQSVREIEICVICDGSPPHMLDMLRDLAQQDTRIRVFSFPKGPRHGEIYRHQVITQEASGAIICYLSHDDLYLPWHVESMERALQSAQFVNSIAVSVATGDEHGETRPEVLAARITDLSIPVFRRLMLDWRTFRWGFGLIFGAHTRDAYLSLPEGWTTTPAGIPTDMFMWAKLVAGAGDRCDSVMQVTALHFDRSNVRPDWSVHERDAEIARWLPLIERTDFRATINSLALRSIARDLIRIQGLSPDDTNPELSFASRQLALAAASLRPVPLPRVFFDIWRVWRSGLFERAWYINHNPDVEAKGVNPLWHFVRWGGLEGRSPGPAFNSEWYRVTHPEAPGGVNPVVHYLKTKKLRSDKEGKK